MLITPNMILTAWTSTNDQYSHTQLATNWGRIDLHDHSAGKGVQINGATGIVARSITGSTLASQTINLSEIASGVVRPQIVNLTANGAAADGEMVIVGSSGITIQTPATPFEGSVFSVMIPYGSTATITGNGAATLWLPTGTAAVTTTGSLSGFLIIRFVCYNGSNWAVYSTSGTTAL